MSCPERPMNLLRSNQVVYSLESGSCFINLHWLPNPAQSFLNLSLNGQYPFTKENNKLYLLEASFITAGFRLEKRLNHK